MAEQERGLQKETSILRENMDETLDEEKKQTLGIASIEKNIKELADSVMSFFKYQKERDADAADAERRRQKKDDKKRKDNSIKQKEKGGMSKLLAGLALLGGGIAMLVQGFFDDGPFKGLKKLLGRLMITIGKKLLSTVTKPFTLILDLLKKGVKKFFPKTIAFIKKIPKFVGSFLLKIPKRIFSFVKGIFKKIFSFGKGLAGKVGGKAAGKSGFMTALKKIGGFLLKRGKQIPILGALVGIGFAISRFKKGDIVGGLLELLSGVVAIVPKLGTVLSIAIDVFLAKRDMDRGGVKPSIGFGQIMKNIGNFLLENIRYIPFIGGLWEMGKGLKDIVNGNIVEGLKKIGMGFVYFLPGGALLVDAINFLSGKADAAEEMPEEERGWFDKTMVWIKKKIRLLVENLIMRPINAIKNFFGITDNEEGKIEIKEGSPIKKIIDSILGIFGWFKDVINYVKNKVKGVFGDSAEEMEVGKQIEDIYRQYEDDKGVINDKDTIDFLERIKAEAADAGGLAKLDISRVNEIAKSEFGDEVKKWEPREAALRDQMLDRIMAIQAQQATMDTPQGGDTYVQQGEPATQGNI